MTTQTVSYGSATGGTFMLAGSAPINVPSNAAAIQTALNTVYGAGNTLVAQAGTAGNAFVVVFVGTMFDTVVPPMGIVDNTTGGTAGANVTLAEVVTPLPPNQPGLALIPSVAQIVLDLHLSPTLDAAEIAALNALWASFADKEAIYPRLGDLYTRRQVCEYLLGGVWRAVDFVQQGVDEKDSDWTEHLAGLQKIYSDQIAYYELQAAATRTPSSGVMCANPPSACRPGVFGANMPGGPRNPWFGPYGRW